MTPANALKLAILPALDLLGQRYASRDALVMMLAIALQESRLTHRVQIGGPARGYWQFERLGGVAGVLAHTSSKAEAARVCGLFDVAPSSGAVYEAIAYQDILAAVFARLLLWTDPAPLPSTEAAGWALYQRTWRPGKPHPQTWPEMWARAIGAVA